MKWNDEKVKEFAKLYISGTGGKTMDDKLKHFKNTEKTVWLEKRKELYFWQKRAEAVGITPLPSYRPSKKVRRAWENSVIHAEGIIQRKNKMNVKDVLTNAIEMMEMVQNKADELQKKMNEVLTLTNKYRQYIETSYPEIHNKAIDYIKENN